MEVAGVAKAEANGGDLHGHSAAANYHLIMATHIQKSMPQTALT
jgi:hypothetical protein